MSTAVPPINLIANGKTLSTAPNRLGYLSPTDPTVGIETIRKLFTEQGYVWLKGVLPRSDVIGFRGWVFSHLADTGLLKPGVRSCARAGGEPVHSTASSPIAG